METFPQNEESEASFAALALVLDLVVFLMTQANLYAL